jgi:tetratricopeptide (TPR) repeat protein
MAERFLYLPLIGLSLTAAMLFSRLHDPRLRRLVAVGGLGIAIVLCNSHDYIRRNDFTFFANMARVEPNSAKARLGYGYALLQAGQKDEAARQLEAGLQIIPDYPELLTTLAMTQMTATDCSRGWPLLKRALEIDPSHADTHRRMADCYFKEGKVAEAEPMYRHAVESIPYPDSMLYVMWALSLEDTGQTTSAISAYERAALIDPDNNFIKQKLSSLTIGRGGTGRPINEIVPTGGRPVGPTLNK